MRGNEQRQASAGFGTGSAPVNAPTRTPERRRYRTVWSCAAHRGQVAPGHSETSVLQLTALCGLYGPFAPRRGECPCSCPHQIHTHIITVYIDYLRTLLPTDPAYVVALLPPSLNIALRPKSPPPDWRSTRSPGEAQLSTHQESIRAGKGGDGLLATGIVCLVPTSERGPEPRDPRLHVRGGGGAAAAARGKCPFPHLVHDSEARSIRCWLYRWFHMLARSSYVVSSHVAQQRLSSGIDVAFCL